VLFRSLWPMVELEADDALASAAALAAKNRDVQKICIWTPDKDLAQCVRGDRIVQVDRKSHAIRDAEAVRAKFGVIPERIPDYLALVGDAADGYPGIAGIGSKGAAGLIDRFGRIEDFPPEILGERKALALLFKKLATLRDDAPLFSGVGALQWQGARPDFAALAAKLGDPRLVERAAKALHSPKASESRSPTALALKKKSTKAATQPQKRS
jgi:5'-3' exonuclease